MNPLVPNTSEVLLTLGACGYLIVLVITILVLLQDRVPNPRQRLLWLLLILLVPAIGILAYTQIRWRTHRATARN